MKFFSAARLHSAAVLSGNRRACLRPEMSSPAHFLADFEKRVTVKVLPNGLTLIVCERPEAPVFSYFTIVDAGDANDPGGESGLAHMLSTWPSRAPKTSAPPTTPKEKIALDKVEAAYAAYDDEFRKRVG